MSFKWLTPLHIVSFYKYLQTTGNPSNVEFDIFFLGIHDKTILKVHFFQKNLRYFEFAYFQQNFKLSLISLLKIFKNNQIHKIQTPHSLRWTLHLWSCLFPYGFVMSVWAMIRPCFAQVQHFLVPACAMLDHI